MGDIALNLVVLRSRDLARAVGFYTALGLTFAPHRHGSGSDHFAAEFGGVVFELYPLAADGVPTGATRIGFRVSSLEEVMTRLAAFPGCVLSVPKDSEWGRRAVVVDPDGHRVELLQS